MKKIIMASILALAVSIAFGQFTSAEMAKEGSGEGGTYFTTTYQVLAKGKEYVQMNYDARGVSASDNETSPMYKASGQCVGSLQAIKGVYKNDSGLCAYTRPDGDQIFLSYEATGKLGVGGVAKGTFTIIGGTGKCTGMTGSGTFTRTSLKGPAKGIGASMTITKLNWKIP